MKYILAFLLFFSVSAQAETCLDYWKVGPNGDCKKPTYKKETAPKEEPQVPSNVFKEPEQKRPVQEQPQGLSLDSKIDEYIENYDKPPREYVAFHLEPTLENAMRWVKKYRETMSRSRQLSEAWTQAEYLYDSMEAKGVDVDSVVELEQELPEVKGFFKDLKEQDKQGLRFKRDVEAGVVDIPTENSAQNQGRIGGYQAGSNSQMGSKSSGGKPQYDPNVMNQQMMMFLQEAGVDNQQLDFIARRMQGQSAEEASDGSRIGGVAGSTAQNSGRIGGAAFSGSSNKQGRIGGAKPQVSIEYFYSARCPFCRKFEPIFKRVLDEQRKNFDVTVDCVDITPSIPEGKQAKDVLGCAWRGVTDQEFDAKKIEQTPTLLITWAGDQNQRVEGLVDYAKLSQYFNSRK